MTSDRIREIQETTAYPESVSVKQALLQVWNECEQEQRKLHNERMSQLDISINNGDLSDNDASLIIENLLDTLIEVGNGTTDEELHKSADYLFVLRDKWFKKRIK